MTTIEIVALVLFVVVIGATFFLYAKNSKKINKDAKQKENEKAKQKESEKAETNVDKTINKQGKVDQVEQTQKNSTKNEQNSQNIDNYKKMELENANNEKNDNKIDKNKQSNELSEQDYDGENDGSPIDASITKPQTRKEREIQRKKQSDVIDVEIDGSDSQTVAITTKTGIISTNDYGEIVVDGSMVSSPRPNSLEGKTRKELYEITNKQLEKQRDEEKSTNQSEQNLSKTSDKSISDQIQDLSPELKAILFTDIIKPKY